VRPVAWLVGAGGAALALLGVLLFRHANSVPTHGTRVAGYEPLGASSAYESRLDLQFDDRWAVLWTGGHLAGLGLFAAGLLVLTGLAGWGWGRSRPGVSGTRRALALGAVGAALVAGGVVVVLTAGPDPVVSDAGLGWSAVLVASQLAGLGAAVAGALVLAVVTGRSLGGRPRPVDGQ
jgi:hypothetical protein